MYCFVRLFPQLWRLTYRKGGWSWKTWTVTLCMNLSWWSARMGEAWMGQEFNLKWNLLVGISCNYIQHCVILKRGFFIQDVSLSLDVLTVISVTLASGLALTAFVIMMIRLFSYRWWNHCYVFFCLFFLPFRLIHDSYLMQFMISDHHFWLSFCRIKVHFWPAVPDPANSSIKRWSSESTQVLKSSLCIL